MNERDYIERMFGNLSRDGYKRVVNYIKDIHKEKDVLCELVHEQQQQINKLMHQLMIMEGHLKP